MFLKNCVKTQIVDYKSSFTKNHSLGVAPIAITASRPYKEGFSHQKTIAIMNEMVEKNQLEKEFVQVLDKEFSK